MDRHLPSPGWSYTILRMVTHHKNMFTNLPKGWSATIHRMVIHHHQEGDPPSKNWSPTNLRKAAHYHQEGHPLFQGYGRTPSQWWSPTNSWMLTTIHGIVITFPSRVTHHLKDGQLDLEFDSSAAKLVNLVVSLAQLVSLSVAHSSKLVCIYNGLETIRLLRIGHEHGLVQIFWPLEFAPKFSLWQKLSLTSPP